MRKLEDSPFHSSVPREDYENLLRKYNRALLRPIFPCILVFVFLLACIFLFLFPSITPSYKTLASDYERLSEAYSIADQQLNQYQQFSQGSNSTPTDKAIQPATSTSGLSPVDSVDYISGWDIGSTAGYEAGFLRGIAYKENYSSDFMAKGLHLQEEYQEIIFSCFQEWLIDNRPSDP